MNQYGIHENLPEDYKAIAEALKEGTTLILSWTLVKRHASVFILSPKPIVKGRLPLGDAGLVVGMLGYGTNWFKTLKGLAPQDVASALRLGNRERVLAHTFLSGLGEYYE